jgi:uncharacterized protein (TIGR01244 family)
MIDRRQRSMVIDEAGLTKLLYRRRVQRKKLYKTLSAVGAGEWAMSLEQVRQIGTELWTAPQLQADDFAAAAKQGFRTIINMRPDFEEPGQPEAEALRRAAEQAGLLYEFLPVVSGQFTEQNIVDFARQVKELPKPILTFCRTGTRCTNLWALVQAQGDIS